MKHLRSYLFIIIIVTAFITVFTNYNKVDNEKRKTKYFTSEIVFIGTSSMKENNSTDIKLSFGANNTFTLETNTSISTGIYEINLHHGASTVTLTYIDSVTWPNGPPFISKGTSANEQLFTFNNSITFNSFQYMDKVKGEYTLIDLGTVTFYISTKNII